MKSKFMCIAEVITKQIHFFKSTLGSIKPKFTCIAEVDTKQIVKKTHRRFAQLYMCVKNFAKSNCGASAPFFIWEILIH